MPASFAVLHPESLQREAFLAMSAGKCLADGMFECLVFLQHDLEEEQVWSLSSIEVSCELLTNDLNEVSSVSLFMTSLTPLAKKWLFELTQQPSLTWAVSLTFSKPTEEPGCSGEKDKILCKFG